MCHDLPWIYLENLLYDFFILDILYKLAVLGSSCLLLLMLSWKATSKCEGLKSIKQTDQIYQADQIYQTDQIHQTYQIDQTNF